MKKIATVLLFLMSCHVFSQNTISGKVTDNKNNSIEYFNVQLLSTKDSTEIMSTAFIDGKYNLDHLKDGRYTLKFSSFGYETTTRNVILSNDQSKPLNITLPLHINDLKETTVMAKRPKVINKNDRYVVDIENTSISDAGDAIAVLRRTPFIMVDNKTENITVAGRDATIIMINGRQITSKQELKSISSQNIKSIDVIENPSAKYNADGHSVINIITKNNRARGLNADIFSKYTRGRHNSGQIQSDLSYGTKKLIYMGQIGYASNLEEGFNSTIERYENENYSFKANSYNLQNEFKTKMLTYAAGLDYQPNKQHYFSIKLDGMDATVTGNTISNQEKTRNGNVLPTMQLHSLKKDSYNRNTYTFNYKYNKEDISIYFASDYTKYKMTSDNTLDEHTIPATEEMKKINNSNSNYDLFSLQYDISLPVSSLNSKIELGSRFSNINSTNHNAFFNKTQNNWVQDQSYSGDIDYDETLLGSYIMIAGNINDKIKFNGGVRYEFTKYFNKWGESILAQSDRKSHNLFPSLLISYNANKDCSLRLSYSKRIKRPSYKSLNNSLWYINSYSARQGNPQLKPSVYNTLSLSSNYKKINASFNISHIQNPNDLLHINDKKQLERHIVKFVNTTDRLLYSFNINTSYQYKIWSIQPFLSMTFGERAIYEDGVKYSTDYPGVYLKVSNQIDITKRTFLDLDFAYKKMYHSFKTFGEKYEYYCALRHKMFNDKVTLQLAYQYSPSKHTQLFDYSYKYSFFTWDGEERNQLSVSLRYHFNTTKRKFRSRSSSEEELRRM